MRHFAAAYLVPQLPRFVIFPAVFLARDAYMRFDIPLWLVLAVGMPLFILAMAGLSASVKWLKAVIEPEAGDDA